MSVSEAFTISFILWKLKSFSHIRLFATPWIYSPWNSPGQSTGVGSRFLPQGIFPAQGLNPDLPHCRWILYQLSHQGRPFYTLIKLYYIKSSERSSLFTGPGLNSSPPEAMDPSVIHGSKQQPFNTLGSHWGHKDEMGWSHSELHSFLLSLLLSFLYTHVYMYIFYRVSEVTESSQKANIKMTAMFYLRE